MPSNLLKSGYVTYQAEEKRIIDTSELFARKTEHLWKNDSSEPEVPSGEESVGDVYDDMDPEQAKALFGDEIESTTVYREVDPKTEKADSVYGRISGEEMLTQQQKEKLAQQQKEMLEQAQKEIRQMQENARAEIEKLREETIKAAKAEGRQQGYDAGYQEGLSSVETVKKQLEQERQQLCRDYEDKMKELEPVFVEQLTRIYEHVFKVSLRDDVDILLHLIDVALHGIESGKDFIIKTSKDDYPFVSMQKKKLITNIAGASIDVVEDITLNKGQCLIETGGGIFDCSVDLEVQELGKKLRLLSRQNDETR